MRRLVAFLLRNWPLKLGAVALATILYGGLVLSESTLTWRGQVVIDIIAPPPGAAVGSIPVPARDIRYRAPLDVASQLTNGSFRAFVDMAGIEVKPGGESLRLEVEVEAIDPNVEIVGFQPEFVEVLVDPLVTDELAVTVDDGIIPERLDVGPAQVDPAVVTLRGGSTRVSSVRVAMARVNIDGSALNIDEEVDVEPLDDSGNIVAGVVVEPARVRVRITVAPSIETATLPVRPIVEGEVEPGYALRPVKVDPITVTVSGAETDVATLGLIDTEPIDITGRTGIIEIDAALDLPPQVNVSGQETVRVTVHIAPDEGARTVQAGLTLTSTDPALAYSVPASSVLVTLSGTLPALAAMGSGALLGTVSVAGLDAGSHSLPVVVEAPPGMTLQSVEPAVVEVVVSEAPVLQVSPAPTPTPSSGPSPNADPVGIQPSPGPFPSP
ncbi:MAG: CdaR family protein [Chloroflexota bacterium]|nr:CdaR family protein [Chloroflexota bacterium]